MTDARPPSRDGVGPSSLQLPPGHWPSLLEFLIQHFDAIPAAQWRSRFARGLILDEDGHALAADAAYRAGARIHYYRELPAETPIAGDARVLHRDTHLLVADKPHGLPVMPAGRYVQETLLVRLKRQTGLDDLVPLHRIDRDTAGLVLFSIRADSRAAYQALFPQRAIEKTYEALAPPLPLQTWPLLRRSRIVRDTATFFRMREVEGEANSETRIERIEARGAVDLYRLQPLTGRKHQLRVHMAALGAPILHDPYYPELRPRLDDSASPPLQLLARSLQFVDPLNGQPRRFDSALRLREQA
ncbi:MAG TPA: pseudouridine synthase [Solimonas sp.]